MYLNTPTSAPATETILVASANVAMPDGTTAGQVTLIDQTNHDVNLASGQLGIVSAAYGQTTAKGQFIPTADATVAKNRFVQIVQGTPGSASLINGANPNEHQPYMASAVIDGRNIKAYGARIYDNPELNAWFINTVAAIDEKEYNMHIGFTGQRNNIEFSMYGIETLTSSFVTPNYTDLQLNAAAATAHLLSNLAYNINQNSTALNLNATKRGRGNKEVIVLGLDLSGGAGLAVNGLVAGTPISVMSVNGNTVTFTPDQQFVDTVVAANAASTPITNATTIEVIDLTTALAGTSTIDSLLVIALDKKKAIVTDLEPTVKVRLHIGLDGHFTETLATATELVKAYEGFGDGRIWKLRYDSYHGLNRYTNQLTEFGEGFITPPSYVDTTKRYNAFIIEHVDAETVNYSHTNYFPKRTIILVEASTSGVGLANAVTSLNAFLGANGYLGSAEIPNKQLLSGGAYFA